MREEGLRETRYAGGGAGSLQEGRLRAVWAAMVTRNAANQAIACLTSLRTGRRSPQSIVVVDNGSSEHETTVLRRYCRGRDDIHLIEKDTNLGYAGAANVGVRFALDHGADAILLINDDATVTEQALEILVDVAERSPSFAMFGPRILFHDDPRRVWQGGGRYSVLKRGVLGNERRKPVSACSNALREVTYLTGCVALIRREVFEMIGPYDEDYFLYAEDPDFCLRARRAGLRLLYVPSATATHKVPSHGTRPLSAFRLYHSGRSHALCLRKNHRYVWLAVGICSHLLLHGPHRLLHLLRGAGPVRDIRWWLRGTWDGLMGRTPALGPEDTRSRNVLDDSASTGGPIEDDRGEQQPSAAESAGLHAPNDP